MASKFSSSGQISQLTLYIHHYGDFAGAQAVSGIADVLPRVLTSHVGQHQTVIDYLMSPGKRCTELRPGDRGFWETCEQQTSLTHNDIRISFGNQMNEKLQLEVF